MEDNDDDSHTTLDDTSVDLLAPTPPPSSPESEASPATQTLNTLSQSHIMFVEPPLDAAKKSKTGSNRLHWRQAVETSALLPSVTTSKNEASTVTLSGMSDSSQTKTESPARNDTGCGVLLSRTAESKPMNSCASLPRVKLAVNSAHRCALDKTTLEVDAVSISEALQDPRLTVTESFDDLTAESPSRILTRLTQSSNDFAMTSPSTSKMLQRDHCVYSTPSVVKESYAQIIYNTLERMTQNDSGEDSPERMAQRDTGEDASTTTSHVTEPRYSKMTTDAIHQPTGQAVPSQPTSVTCNTSGFVDRSIQKSVPSDHQRSTNAVSNEVTVRKSEQSWLTKSVRDSKHDESDVQLNSKARRPTELANDSKDDRMVDTVWKQKASTDSTSQLKNKASDFGIVSEPKHPTTSTNASNLCDSSHEMNSKLTPSNESTTGSTNTFTEITPQLERNDDCPSVSAQQSELIAKTLSRLNKDASAPADNPLLERLLRDFCVANTVTVASLSSFKKTGSCRIDLPKQFSGLVLLHLTIADSGPIGLTISNTTIGHHKYCVVSEVVSGSLAETAGFLEADLLLSAGSDTSLTCVTYAQLAKLSQASSRPLIICVARQTHEETSERVTNDESAYNSAAPPKPTSSSEDAHNERGFIPGSSRGHESNPLREGGLDLDISQGCRPVSEQDAESADLESPEAGCLLEESEHSQTFSPVGKQSSAARYDDVRLFIRVDGSSQALFSTATDKDTDNEETESPTLNEFDTIDCDASIPIMASPEPHFESSWASPHRSQCSTVLPAILDETDIENVPIQFCDVCTHGKLDKKHHRRCPKASSFDRTQFMEMIQGYNKGCGHCKLEYRKGYGKGSHSRTCPRRGKPRNSMVNKMDEAQSSQLTTTSAYPRKSERRIIMESKNQSNPPESQPKKQADPSASQQNISPETNKNRMPKKLSMKHLKAPCLFCEGCKKKGKAHQLRCSNNPDFDKDRFVAMMKGFNKGCKGCRDEYKYGRSKNKHMDGCSRRQIAKQESEESDLEPNDDEDPSTELVQFCNACQKNKGQHHTLCHHHPTFETSGAKERLDLILDGVAIGCASCQHQYTRGVIKTGIGSRHAMQCKRRGRCGRPPTKHSQPKASTEVQTQQSLMESSDDEEDPVSVPYCTACKKQTGYHHRLCPQHPDFPTSRAKQTFSRMLAGLKVGCESCKRQYATGEKARSIRHSEHCIRRGNYKRQDTFSQGPTKSKTRASFQPGDEDTGQREIRRSKRRMEDATDKSQPEKKRQKQSDSSSQQVGNDKTVRALKQKRKRGTQFGCQACKYKLDNGKTPQYIRHDIDCTLSTVIKAPTASNTQVQIEGHSMGSQASQERDTITLSQSQSEDLESLGLSDNRSQSERESQLLVPVTNPSENGRSISRKDGRVPSPSKKEGPLLKRRKPSFDSQAPGKYQDVSASTSTLKSSSLSGTTRVEAVTPDATSAKRIGPQIAAMRSTEDGDMTPTEKIPDTGSTSSKSRAEIRDLTSPLVVVNENSDFISRSKGQSAEENDGSQPTSSMGKSNIIVKKVGTRESVDAADNAQNEVKERFLDATVSIADVQVPFCRACMEVPKTVEKAHSALCPKHPHFHQSGAREKLIKIRQGVLVGCAACLAQFQRGSRGKDKPNHSSICVSLCMQESGNRNKNSIRGELTHGTTPISESRGGRRGHVTPDIAVDSERLNKGTKIRLSNHTNVVKPIWTSCGNPWGPQGYHDGDIVVSSDGSFTHHEVSYGGKRFTSDPFEQEQDFGYHRTHHLPGEGTHMLILTRDPMTNISWGFVAEHHDFGGACLVHAVDSNSPASAAKLVGNSIPSPLTIHDMILAINGKPVGGKTEVGIYLEMETSGVELTLTVSRYRFPAQVDRRIAARQVNKWNTLEASLTDNRNLGWCELDLASTGETDSSSLIVGATNFHADESSVDDSLAEIEARAASGIAFHDTEQGEDDSGMTGHTATDNPREEVDNSGGCVSQGSSHSKSNNDEDGWLQDDNPWNGCVCGAIHEPPTPVFWIQCESCDSWYNAATSCVGFNEKEAETKAHWTCNACPSDDEAE